LPTKRHRGQQRERQAGELDVDPAHAAQIQKQERQT
jgi:hypothetical protein